MNAAVQSTSSAPDKQTNLEPVPGPSGTGKQEKRSFEAPPGNCYW